MKRFLTLLLLILFENGWGTLAGGRPNAFSGGQNAFAGVVNPANAVWVPNRFDLGAFLVHQRSFLYNKDDVPSLPKGKTDLTYKAHYLWTVDFAIQKHLKTSFIKAPSDISVGLASYTLPTNTKLRTKMPFPSAGTTPIQLRNRIDAIALIFSFKLNSSQSIGCSLEYFYLSHLRNGYQNADNPQRSVSPGHVTNNGMSHSRGVGLSVGWRWNITKRLAFGTAWTKKSYVGQYRKYRGYEPHHAENFIPETIGAGFSYRLTERLAGRLEMIWSNYGDLPGKNNNILSNGMLNRNKRGSRRSPGPGLQDATFINLGLGYQFSSSFSLGMGLSHRIKQSHDKNMLSHTYRFQTVYDILSFGMNYSHEKNDLFLVLSKGLKNRVSGSLPEAVGGGRLKTEKETTSISISWGYKY